MIKKLTTLIILSFVSYTKAQNKAEEALQLFEQKYPQEKVHLILNKKSYVAGENLWFKSFVFEGYTPSNISTTLYVEFYDNNKTQIANKIFPLFNGEGSGSITLPEKLKEGIYYIRAYTAWMANFSEDFQLIQPVEVYNPDSSEKLVLNPELEWTASAHPESGTFIDGIHTKFAVRIQSEGTAPSDWNGYIVDIEKPDIKIANFKGLDQNIGTFSFTPQSGKKYRLIAEDNKGKIQNIDLPNVSESGINLQVTSNTNAITYTLKSKNLVSESKYYKVLGTINSQLVHKAQFKKISDQSYSIPTDNLVNGILQLTVFDDKENIIAQRLCFVQPDLLKIQKPIIQETALNKQPRSQNLFTIAKNANQPNYTILVQDSETPSSEDDNNLMSQLWLTGDITSPIVNPSQYFIKKDKSEALDALLISEKWKRFDWKSIISGVYPFIKYQPESSYINYKGKVTINNQPASNVFLNLIFDIPEFGSKFLEVQTDKSGMFTLSGMIFDDTMKISYQLSNINKAEYKDVKVFFQPTHSFITYNGKFPKNKFNLIKRLPEDKLSAEGLRSSATKNTQKYIEEKITEIEEVKITLSKKDLLKKLDTKLSSPLFKSINEQVFDFVNDHKEAEYAPNIFTWLQARVPGLEVYSQGLGYEVNLRGQKPMIFLNEMLTNTRHIEMIPVSSIAMVKVIKGTFPAGMGSLNGAIAIYTRTGDMALEIKSKGTSLLKQYTFKGYDKEIPFNNTMYSNPEFKNIPKDNRSTLYWNPSLETQSTEDSTIQFYNNDNALNYRVTIIGYDSTNDQIIYSNEVK